MDLTIFRCYWKYLDNKGKTDLANSVFSTIPYLSHIAHGHRSPSKRMAFLLCQSAGIDFKFGKDV